MDNETEKIIATQIEKLPNEVVTFVSSTNWGADVDEIGALYNLSREELPAFRREVTLVLAGLTHPDEFKDVLEHEVGIQGAVLEALVKSVEEKIFAPIRSALVEFLKKEDESEDAKVTSVEEAPETPTEEEVARAANIFPKEIFVATPIPPAPTRVWEKEPDIAPDNLPIAEVVEPLIPPIPPKAPKTEVQLSNEASGPVHPFEEKMKKVFTAGQQSMGELVIEETTPQAPAPVELKTPPTRHIDPYREAIE